MTVEDFRGDVICGHEWFSRDFTGQRVAVIGPGRDVAQIVPEVAATALAVKVFQEEPAWVLPMPVPGPPGLRLAVARAFLRRGVRDPWIRRQLTPHRRFGSRRLTTGVGYFGALRRPNCKLITWPVYAFVAEGVRTAEGIEHHVDCIVVGPHSVYARKEGLLA